MNIFPGSLSMEPSLKVEKINHSIGKSTKKFLISPKVYSLRDHREKIGIFKPRGLESGIFDVTLKDNEYFRLRLLRVN